MQKVKLKDIATIRFGSNGEHQPTGEAMFLLARHFDDFGQINFKQIDSFVPIDKKVKNQLLQTGNVIFAGKGFRFFAWHYDTSLGNMVASSLFFIIKINSEYVLPEFLSIYLNQPQQLNFFRQLSAGSNIPSIRKSELEDIEIPLISLEKQKQVIHFYQLHLHSLQILQNIEQQKQILANQMITVLIDN